MEYQRVAGKQTLRDLKNTLGAAKAHIFPPNK